MHGWQAMQQASFRLNDTLSRYAYLASLSSSWKDTCCGCVMMLTGAASMTVCTAADAAVAAAPLVKFELQIML